MYGDSKRIYKNLLKFTTASESMYIFDFYLIYLIEIDIWVIIIFCLIISLLQKNQHLKVGITLKAFEDKSLFS